MFHWVEEGESHKQGINFRWDKASQPILSLRVGRLMLWLRRRSTWVMKANYKAQRYFFYAGLVNKPNLSIDWRKHFELGGINL